MRPQYYAELTPEGWRFARADASGITLLPAGAMPPAGSDVSAFVPGSDVTAHRVKIAARRPAELARLAAFAIEDDVAVPVEHIHTAVSPQPDEKGYRTVYAVGHDLMADWIMQLENMGLGKAAIVPDLSVLPDNDSVDFGDRLLVNAGGVPVAIDAHWPADVTAAIHKQLNLTSLRSVDDSLLQLARWASEADKAKLTNLRQGKYARFEEMSLPLDRLRVPAALAATLLIAWGAQTAYATHTMNELSASLLSTARAQYASAFPGQSVPSNPAAALRSGPGSTTPVAAPTFRTSSAALYEAVAGVSGVSLVSLRYDRSAGEFRATLTYPAFGADLDLKKSIEAKRLAVDLGDTRMEDGRVVGDLAIGGAS